MNDKIMDDIVSKVIDLIFKETKKQKVNYPEFVSNLLSNISCNINYEVACKISNMHDDKLINVLNFLTDVQIKMMKAWVNTVEKEKMN